MMWTWLSMKHGNCWEPLLMNHLRKTGCNLMQSSILFLLMLAALWKGSEGVIDTVETWIPDNYQRERERKRKTQLVRRDVIEEYSPWLAASSHTTEIPLCLPKTFKVQYVPQCFYVHTQFKANHQYSEPTSCTNVRWGSSITASAGHKSTLPKVLI